MAKGFDKFLHIIGFDPDEESNQTDSGRESMARASASSSARKGSAPRTRGQSAPSGPSRVVSMPTAKTAPAADAAAVRMVILRPQSSNDVEMIIDNLLEGRAVVIVLANADKGEALRIVDYVAGAIYALGGEMKKVDKTIFLCAPHGVDISGDVAASFASSLHKTDRR